MIDFRTAARCRLVVFGAIGGFVGASLLAGAAFAAPPGEPKEAPPAATVSPSASAAPPAGPPASDAPPAPPTADAGAQPNTNVVPGTTTAITPGGGAVAPGGGRQYANRRSRYITWDANIEGAVGYSFEADGHLTGFGRARAGLLFVNEEDIQAPAFRALGVTYEFSDFTPATFGIQVETLSLNSGTWLQAGVLVDIQPRPGFMLGAGLSLLGIEGQVRWSEEAGVFVALFGKLRIPLGVIGVALGDK